MKSEMNLKALVGSGDKIGLVAMPFLIVGLFLNFLCPSWFTVGGPPVVLKWISIVFLIPGLVIWLWSVVLIVTKVPKGELITTGPYALMKHPIYNGVALLVAPWLGFLVDSWLGVLIGIVLCIGSRLYASLEERKLEETFRSAWVEYSAKVKVPWL